MIDIRRGRAYADVVWGEGGIPEDQSGQFTELLHRWTQGDEEALGALVPLVYKELRRVAHYQLQLERPDHTLQSTALVHEAYLRLIGGQPVELQNRAHFITDRKSVV